MTELLTELVLRQGGVVDCGLPISPEDKEYTWQEHEAGLNNRTHRHILRDHTQCNTPIDLCCMKTEFKVVDAHPGVLRQCFYDHEWRSFPNAPRTIMDHFPQWHSSYARSCGTEGGNVWQQVCDQLSIGCVSLMRHCSSPGGRGPCLHRDTGG